MPEHTTPQSVVQNFDMGAARETAYNSREPGRYNAGGGSRISLTRIFGVLLLAVLLKISFP